MPDELTSTAINEAHIDRFTRRARWLRRAAYFILFVIFLLIIAGALVYQQAADIAARDVGVETAAPTHFSLDELNITKKTLEEEIRLLKATLEAYEQQYEVAQTTLLEVLAAHSQYSKKEGEYQLLLVKIDEFTRTGQPVNINSISTFDELRAARDKAVEQLEYVRRILELSRRRLERGAGSVADVNQAELQFQNVNGTVELLNQQLETYQIRQGAEADATTVDLPIVVQTNITRFGTLIIIIFFISILVPIYRYNIQSAAFYDAVADALVLSRDTGSGDLMSLVEVLTPTVGFGKGPASPIQQSTELIKALGRSRQS